MMKMKVENCAICGAPTRKAYPYSGTICNAEDCPVGGTILGEGSNALLQRAIRAKQAEAWEEGHHDGLGDGHPMSVGCEPNPYTPEDSK